MSSRLAKKHKKEELPKGNVNSFFNKTAKKSTGTLSRERSNQKETSSSTSSSTTPNDGVSSEETAEKIANLVVKKMQQQEEKSMSDKKLKCSQITSIWRPNLAKFSALITL